MSSPVNAAPPPRPHASAPAGGRHDARATGAGQAGPGSAFALLLRDQGEAADAQALARPANSADGSAGTPSEATRDQPASSPAAPGSAAPADAASWPPPGWTPPVRSDATPVLADGSAAGAAAEALDGVSERRGAHAAARRHATTSAADEAADTDGRRTDTQPAQARPGGDAADAGLAAAATPERAAAAAPVKEAANDGSLPSLGAAADTTAPTLPAAASAEAAAPARAELPQPPGSPGFAPALGLQLSTWLRDGIQHASLELNPADLGPIDVRIAVRDGQAQVDLAADVPATRQALAEALPQLAGALGDVGINLSGGSVSDQGARRQDGEALARQAQATASSPGSVRSGTEPAMAPAPATAARHRGLLDLYA